ncbi:MAG: hypothetical protein H6745_06070 [Deltaproteobacteria bacterium]|nr:hypothetical protein [Deltaproteobacteria bacterium]
MERRDARERPKTPKHLCATGSYLDSGAVIVALVVPEGDGGQQRPNQEPFYFAVADLDAAHARAAALGCLAPGDVHGEPGGEIRVRPWRERSFYADDPFGNPLCFVAAGTEFTGRR